MRFRAADVERILPAILTGILTIGVALLLALGTAEPCHAAGGLMFDEALIPQFTIPKTSSPPTIDGRIEPGKWKESAQVMGVVDTSSLNYKDRPVSFRVAWDDNHLYIAHRVDVLTGKTPHLLRAERDTYDTGVVYDDAVQVGLFLHDRNRKEGEETSYLKFVLNSLGAGEYMKNYPSIGQVMFNWTPTFKIASQIVADSAGKQWWEQEVAMDLDDLQMKAPHKAGEKVGIGLFSVVHNPAGWYWLDFPSVDGG